VTRADTRKCLFSGFSKCHWDTQRFHSDADKGNVDISVEDGVLTVQGRLDFSKYEGMQPVYTEYNIGHYWRSFSLPPTPTRCWSSWRTPTFLINEKKVSGLQPMLPLLKSIVQSGKPLLIIVRG
jgi:hypothetical protein